MYGLAIFEARKCPKIRHFQNLGLPLGTRKIPSAFRIAEVNDDDPLASLSVQQITQANLILIDCN